jgi:hypothetical protein
LKWKNSLGEVLMNKTIASTLAVMGMATALVLAITALALGRDNRVERSTLSISQSVDRSDARIAVLKANLRLTEDQAKHWNGLETALHDIATNRANRTANQHDLQTGRASASAPPIADGDAAVGARSDVRSNRDLDDIAIMQTQADALAAQSAELRKISNAAKPLYDSLDERQRHRLAEFVHDDFLANEIEGPRGRRRR